MIYSLTNSSRILHGHVIHDYAIQNYLHAVIKSWLSEYKIGVRTPKTWQSIAIETTLVRLTHK